ncbi:riboflavin kinase [Paenibacillus sp. GCM10027626]|uniref:riboflavin kinase n=1 Tax=Paenibacillus sp. GCM10027626 TaxID=3273411 RepID=UPI0036380691
MSVKQHVSHDHIRELITRGEVETAGQLLGRAYSMSGRIVSGNQLGRKFGFPTANLELSGDFIHPKPGVYLGSVEWEEQQADDMRIFHWNCLISAGYRPTVGGRSYKVEAYLLDYAGNLYGKQLTVSFLEKIRDELHFTSTDDLIKQMHADEQLARQKFGLPLQRQINPNNIGVSKNEN